MKYIYLIMLVMFGVSQACAQNLEVRVHQLSDEEIMLIQAYRQNPEPFRRILYGEGHGRGSMERHAPMRPMGPRDVVDVTIEGGAIEFHGKYYGYEPVSFRLVRGETKEIVIRRQRSSEENMIVVAFRSDGFHFDIPEQRPGTRAPEHGYLIIGEDPRWNTGEPIPQNDQIRAKFSRAHPANVIFHLRYATVR